MQLLQSRSAPSLAIAILLTAFTFDAMASDTLEFDNSVEDGQLERAARNYNAMQTEGSSKVVCAKESQSGGRFVKKVCRTVSSMDSDERKASNFVRSNQRAIIANERTPNPKKQDRFLAQALP